LPADTCCHRFRATGVAAYLEHGGLLERAQRIAGHSSPRTTKLYDRGEDGPTAPEMESIGIWRATFCER
jgi:integrase